MPREKLPSSSRPIEQAAVAAPEKPGARGDEFHLDAQVFKLDNGLTVVVNEDHAAPVVAVSITFKVGSQDEKPGLAGFAHLFEHLMFQGTKNLGPTEISRLVESNGGQDNAYTMKSNTTYHEVIPKAALATILWAEADRMTGLQVDARSLAIEQQVVLEEMRRSYLNQPYARALDAGMAEAVFTKWENRHTTIGDPEDIRNAKLSDVQAFYRSHYAPNNAVLALAGDVTVAEAESLVKRYFDKIPSRPVEARADLSEPPLETEVRRRFEDGFAKTPITVAAWRVPERREPDFWALNLLAGILDGGEESPLHQALVKKAQTALSAEVVLPRWSQLHNMRGPELMAFFIAPKNGVSSERVVAGLDEVLERFRSEGPTAEELERVKTQALSRWTGGFQSLIARAQVLSSYAALVGDPRELAGDLKRLTAVTAGDVTAAARRWLGPARLVLDVVPGKPAAPAAAPAAPEPPAEEPRRPGEAPPGPLPSRAVPVPALERFALSNGLKVILTRDRRLPWLEARLALPAGRVNEGAGEGPLSAAVGDILLKGAEGQDAADVARAFSGLGCDVRTEHDEDFVKVEASGLASRFEPFFAQLGKVLGGATYPEAEAALWRENTVQEIEMARARPNFLLKERVLRELFGAHPYGREVPAPEEIARVSSSSLRAYHRRWMTPRGGFLLLVCPLERTAVADALERAFSGWSGPMATMAFPPLPAPSAGKVAIVDRPGSSQAALSVAQALPLTPLDPDYLAFQVMNHALGGTANARLFENLRNKNGFTYGAYSRAVPYKAVLGWSAGAEVRNEVIAPAVAEIFKEIRRVREEPIGAAELELARRHLAGLFLIQLSSLRGTADFLSTLEEQGRDPADVLAHQLKRLEALTSQALQEAAYKYLDPERMKIVAVGDGPALEKALVQYR